VGEGEEVGVVEKEIAKRLDRREGLRLYDDEGHGRRGKRD